jgi:antibiotic biosynthesis monooxygenase (ABM) superfamily enzyme
MKPEGSLLRSQEPSTGPYPEITTIVIKIIIITTVITHLIIYLFMCCTQIARGQLPNQTNKEEKSKPIKVVLNFQKHISV